MQNAFTIYAEDSVSPRVERVGSRTWCHIAQPPARQSALRLQLVKTSLIKKKYNTKKRNCLSFSLCSLKKFNKITNCAKNIHHIRVCCKKNTHTHTKVVVGRLPVGCRSIVQHLIADIGGLSGSVCVPCVWHLQLININNNEPQQ